MLLLGVAAFTLSPCGWRCFFGVVLLSPLPSLHGGAVLPLFRNEIHLHKYLVFFLNKHNHQITSNFSKVKQSQVM